MKKIWVTPKGGKNITFIARPEKSFEFKGPPPYEIVEKDFPLISDTFEITKKNVSKSLPNPKKGGKE